MHITVDDHPSDPDSTARSGVEAGTGRGRSRREGGGMITMLSLVFLAALFLGRVEVAEMARMIFNAAVRYRANWLERRLPARRSGNYRLVLR